MQVTSTHYRRLPLGATLLVALAFVALGFAALTTKANAAFILDSGTLALTDGSGSADPPKGSWVTLPTDDPEDPPFYPNVPWSTWEGGTGKYTLIKNANDDESTTALELGATQSSGIFGNTTDPFQSIDFSAITTSAPKLVFYGSAKGKGTRKLKYGVLPLDIEWNEGIYDVSTGTKPSTKRVVPLTGYIHGDATKPGATITLDWITDLDEPGFDPYQAHFHWEGHYTPPS